MAGKLLRSAGFSAMASAMFKSQKIPDQLHQFSATLFTLPDKGGWTFLEVPAAFAPPVTGCWGMTPVLAEVDGRAWATTVWREKSGRSLLPVPKRIRQKKAHGDEVGVSLRVDAQRVKR
jgi:hypothetical protein